MTAINAFTAMFERFITLHGLHSLHLNVLSTGFSIIQSLYLSSFNQLFEKYVVPAMALVYYTNIRRYILLLKDKKKLIAERHQQIRYNKKVIFGALEFFNVSIKKKTFVKGL